MILRIENDEDLKRFQQTALEIKATFDRIEIDRTAFAIGLLDKLKKRLADIEFQITVYQEENETGYNVQE